MELKPQTASIAIRCLFYTCTGAYNESVLGGWTDALDEPLYAWAAQVFHRNLARHGMPLVMGMRA